MASSGRSAAIPIVRPSQNNTPLSSPTPQAMKPPSSPGGTKPENRLCRNVLIYGSCKYKDRGCQFSHDLPSTSTPRPSSPAVGASNATSTPFSVASAAAAAVFVPGGASLGPPVASGEGGSGAQTPGGTVIAAKSAAAAEFVPRRAATPALSEDAAFFTPPSGQATSEVPLAGGAENGYDQEQNEEHHQTPEGLAEYYQQMDLNGQQYDQNLSPEQQHLQQQHQQQQQQQQHHNPYAAYPQGAPPPMSAAQEAAYYNNGGMGGLQMGGMGHYQRQPLQYHLYHPLPSVQPRSHPHSALPRPPPSLAPHSPTTSFFLPPSLHIALTSKSEAVQAVASASAAGAAGAGGNGLPEEVGGYTGLVSLDKGEGQQGSAQGPQGQGQGPWNGHRGHVYKAWKEGEGRCYVLRRIEGFRLQHEAAIASVEKWTRVRHPGLVGVKEAFTTRAFGDQSIVFVSDYHPTSQTLYEAHLSPSAVLPPNPWSTPHSLSSLNPTSTASPFRRPPSSTPTAPSSSSPASSSAPGGTLPERVLWSYIVQIASALKCVHNQGLAMRTVEVNRVLVTGKNRVRLAGAGVMDCLGWDGGQNAPGHQQDDLLSFGKLIIALSCASTQAVHNLPKSVDHISRMYSPDLKNVVLYLLSKPGPRKTIEEVFALMGGRVVDELNSSLVAEDTIERELMRELENGRLVRLLTKFGFINERPEFDHDPRWAETGDRYLIKLFRDYVFHQVDETGRPVTDLGHVIGCLNKLDAGVDEKLMLVSRDEQSCLIVSYREIKNCIESAYADLSRTSVS